MADIPIIGRRLITCRGCGCDDDHACITDHGPCAWVLLDVEITPAGVTRLPSGVCSGCAEEVRWHPLELAHMGFEEPSRADVERMFGT